MVLAALAAAALAQGAPHLPNHPDPMLAWPSAEDIARVYPPEALRRRVGARVVIRCTVAHAGMLRDCRVVAEDPPQYGFGQAALQLVPQLRMEPTHARQGGTVRIPIRFGFEAQAAR